MAVVVTAVPLGFPRIVQLRPEIVVVGVVIVIVIGAAAAAATTSVGPDGAD